jgi:phosphatidylglycerophosphate synthase
VADLARIEPPWDQRLAAVLVQPLRHSRVTPNAITALTLVLGLLGAWLFTRAGAAIHVGAALVMLAFLLDHADGELARLTGRTSAFGHYFDLIADALVMCALFVGIGLGLAAGDPSAAKLGLIAGVAVALAVLLRLELERRAGKTATRQPSLLGFELQDLLYLVGPATWLGGLEAFLMLAAIGAPLYALGALWSLGRHLWRASRRP